jgi:hypothetical protein
LKRRAFGIVNLVPWKSTLNTFVIGNELEFPVNAVGN